MDGTLLFEANLAGKEWVAGEAFSLADINAFNSLYVLPHMGERMKLPCVSIDRTPLTMRWLKRMFQRPSIKRAWSHSRGGMNVDIDAEANRKFD
jgi:GSH-dependent disulfide-bond oxidoreductase